MKKIFKKYFWVILLVITFSFSLWGCGNENNIYTNTQEETTTNKIVFRCT